MNPEEIMPFEEAFETGLSHVCASCKSPLLVVPGLNDKLHLTGFRLICSKCLTKFSGWISEENVRPQVNGHDLTVQEVLATYSRPMKFWRDVRIPVNAMGEIIFDKCWTWMKSVDRSGYGWKRTRKHIGRSHRYAYAISHPLDPLADGMIVRHACDNPRCSNPTHLIQGTYLENMQDCLLRNRLNSKLNIKEVRIIMKLADMGLNTKQLSSLFDVQPWQIQAILRGYSWRIARGIYTRSGRKKYQNHKTKPNKNPDSPKKFSDSDWDPLPVD